MEDADPQGSLPWGGTTASVNIMANPLISSINIQASYRALPNLGKAHSCSQEPSFMCQRNDLLNVPTVRDLHGKVLQEGQI